MLYAFRKSSVNRKQILKDIKILFITNNLLSLKKN